MEKFVILKSIEENSFGSVSKAIEYAVKLYGKMPYKPAKPVLKSNHTAHELKEYTSNFEAYEAGIRNYELDRDAFNKNKRVVDSAIEEYIKEQSEFNKYVPKDRQQKVWGKAWEDGHSSGWYEIYLELNNLVEIFK